ncbi:lipid-binding protein [Saccharicrinis aurantiacus]|uniref:lipid-binding protein n=1 Tax=Saccharicrinis aurantiacus TaxID=1849719 RepID=UPI0024903E23|nr:lipid-binding protein [Saccharicrinis aurantiacus]
MKLNYIIVLLVLVGLYSCDPYDTMGEPEKATTEVGKMLAGEWYVKFYLEESALTGYNKITTTNTAANTSTKMQIDDHENVWDMKGVLDCDTKNNTFSGTDVENSYYDMTFTVTNGEVFPGKGITEVGNVTDSIYMEIEYSDDPGNVYVVAGIRRTGFLEDEH